MAPTDPQKTKPTRPVMLFTAQRYRVFYLSISKCGCTYVKNLLWHFDHDAPHPSGDRIHDHGDELERFEPPVHEEIAAEPHAFVVVRNPVDRFLSLYFDKVIGPGHLNFVPLRQSLIDQRGLDPDPQSPQAHRDNCSILLDWLVDTMERRVKMPVNAHWFRQSLRLHNARRMNLKVLTLDGLNAQLPCLLGDLVPDLAQRMAAVKSRNVAPRPITKGQLITNELRRAVNTVYEHDREIYVAARDAWKALDPARISAAEVPRYQALTAPSQDANGA